MVVSIISKVFLLYFPDSRGLETVELVNSLYISVIGDVSFVKNVS